VHLFITLPVWHGITMGLAGCRTQLAPPGTPCKCMHTPFPRTDSACDVWRICLRWDFEAEPRQWPAGAAGAATYTHPSMELHGAGHEPICDESMMVHSYATWVLPARMPEQAAVGSCMGYTCDGGGGALAVSNWRAPWCMRQAGNGP
jgi:hypothetical protein